MARTDVVDHQKVILLRKILEKMTDQMKYVVNHHEDPCVCEKCTLIQKAEKVLST